MKHKIEVSYNGLQSHEGRLNFEDSFRDSIRFTDLRISGNILIVYVSDNGWTDATNANERGLRTFGKIGYTFDLNDYYIEYKR